MEFLLALVTSRVAPVVAALGVGLLVGWWKTDASWRQWEKGQEVIRKYNQQVELAREAQNAVEIAKAATERVEDDEAELSKLRQQVADFDKGEANAKDPCLMDSRLTGAADRMRQPTPPRRHPKLTRPSK